MKKISIILFTIVSVFLITGCNNQKYDYLVLVNKENKLPDDWEEKVELVTTKNAWDEEIQVEKEAFKSYKELKKDLEKEGVYIELDSVYRSVKAQQDLWNEWSADPEKGPEYVKKFMAVPGYSEHHTGLAIDICIKKDGELIYDNDEMIAETEIFAKIHKKLADYGFILRYPKDREDSTGYTYEPWHLRYVGSVKIAKEITEKGLTLEEYLNNK
jgi:D-alanyl-D-alanine carboxypeptidase